VLFIKPMIVNLFLEHSKVYHNTWNPETLYFQPRDREGNYQEPFYPLLLTYLDPQGTHTNDYVEGSALQWRWNVFHDPQGLIDLFGSQDLFVTELNDFFAQATPELGAAYPGPYYWHGNEPDIHAPYLFNSADRPDLTQKWVRWILDNKYGDGPDGIDGNDDAGTLAAWYNLSALGFYPVAGSDIYQIGAPLFERATLHMSPTQTLTVFADNYAPDHLYVKRVWLNGVPLDRLWFTHDEIQNGAELRFEMSSSPLTKQLRK